MGSRATVEAWPALPWAEWSESCETLHLWTQIVGKVKLELSPFLNEWWQVGFDVTPRGLTASSIPFEDGAFAVEFDFIDHGLRIVTSEGGIREFALAPRSVAAFYGDFMARLRELGIDARIHRMPVEMPNPIPFDQDERHASYEPRLVHDWWRVLVSTTKVLQRYREGFSGKSSPIVFYWGSFDLNETRFSGRPAPRLRGVPLFYELAEDEENVACGFWPGNANAAGVTLEEAAFYAYHYPEPPGFRDARVEPDGARYDTRLNEFLLPYDRVRTAAFPEALVLRFFENVYEVAADLAHWDRARLDSKLDWRDVRVRRRASPGAAVH
jgi:hypothetical protein